MASTNERRRGRKLMKIGRKVRKPLDKILIRYSEVGDPSVFGRDQFPWVADLERHWQVIREEARTVMQDEGRTPPLRRLSPDHRGIATKAAA